MAASLHQELLTQDFVTFQKSSTLTCFPIAIQVQYISFVACSQGLPSNQAKHVSFVKIIQPQKDPLMNQQALYAPYVAYALNLRSPTLNVS